MASLQLSDPFEGFEDMFKSLWRPVRVELATPAPAIKIEVSENDSAYTVKAQIPGVRKEDIKVNIDGATVSIGAETKEQKEEKKNGKVLRSEFQYGAAERTFTLGTDIDTAKAGAKYENGILELTLPKKANGKATTLPIQ